MHFYLYILELLCSVGNDRRVFQLYHKWSRPEATVRQRLAAHEFARISRVYRKCDKCGGLLWENDVHDHTLILNH